MSYDISFKVKAEGTNCYVPESRLGTGGQMRVGEKKYRLLYCLKRWRKSNFSKYNSECNYQCAFGIRSPHYKDHKCLNRFHPIKCGECWRGDRHKSNRRANEADRC